MELRVIEHENQRVLLTSQLAESYGTDDKSISYNFNHNKDRYQEGKHYFLLQGNDLRAFREIHDLPTNLNKIYLWTERGAFLHAKSLNTDKAWEVYDSLVESYFQAKQRKMTLESLSDLEKTRLLFGNQLEIAGKVDDLGERVAGVERAVTEFKEAYIENQVLSASEDGAMRRAVSRRVDEVMRILFSDISSAKVTALHKMLRKVVFLEFNRNICGRFGVRYRNQLTSKTYNTALQYVYGWLPQHNFINTLPAMYLTKEDADRVHHALERLGQYE